MATVDSVARLLALGAKGSGGGGTGGTSNYPDLANKPQINGVELVGNKTSEDLGIVGEEELIQALAAESAARQKEDNLLQGEIEDKIAAANILAGENIEVSQEGNNVTIKNGISIATSEKTGMVKPDGETITVDAEGVIKALSGGEAIHVIRNNAENAFILEDNEVGYYLLDLDTLGTTTVLPSKPKVFWYGASENNTQIVTVRDETTFIFVKYHTDVRESQTTRNIPVLTIYSFDITQDSFPTIYVEEENCVYENGEYKLSPGPYQYFKIAGADDLPRDLSELENDTGFITQDALSPLEEEIQAIKDLIPTDTTEKVYSITKENNSEENPFIFSEQPTGIYIVDKETFYIDTFEGESPMPVSLPGPMIFYYRTKLTRDITQETTLGEFKIIASDEEGLRLAYYHSIIKAIPATGDQPITLSPESGSVEIVTETSLQELAPDAVPIATTEVAGKVKPDGETITINEEGVISAGQAAETMVLDLGKEDFGNFQTNQAGIEFSDSDNVNAAMSYMAHYVNPSEFPNPVDLQITNGVFLGQNIKSDGSVCEFYFLYFDKNTVDQSTGSILEAITQVSPEWDAVYKKSGVKFNPLYYIKVSVVNGTDLGFEPTPVTDPFLSVVAEDIADGKFYEPTEDGQPVSLHNVMNLVSPVQNDLSELQLTVQTLEGQVESIITSSFEVVDELPTSDIKTNVIYLVPTQSSGIDNVYDEYIYVNNNWEKIGTTALDLSQYATKEYVDDKDINSVKYTADNNVELKNHIVTPFGSGLYGSSPENGWTNLAAVKGYNLDEENEIIQTELGSATLHTNINSKDRPTVETSEGQEQVRYLSDTEIDDKSSSKTTTYSSNKIDSLKPVMLSVPVRTKQDKVYTQEEILAWFKVASISDLKLLFTRDNPLFAKYGITLSTLPHYYKMSVEYAAFESANQIKLVFLGLDTSNDEPSRFTVIANLDGTIIDGNSNVQLAIEPLSKSSYNDLLDKPTINNVELKGNVTLDDLNLMDKEQVQSAINNVIDDSESSLTKTYSSSKIESLSGIKVLTGTAEKPIIVSELETGNYVLSGTVQSSESNTTTQTLSKKVYTVEKGDSETAVWYENPKTHITYTYTFDTVGTNAPEEQNEIYITETQLKQAVIDGGNWV